MTLSMSFLHDPYGDCPSTCSASSQRGAASTFTISCNLHVSVPPFPCSFIHTAQAFYLKQTPHSTSTQLLATFIFAPSLCLTLPQVCWMRLLKLTHLFPVPPSFRMHQLTPAQLIFSPISVSAPPTDLCRRE